MIQEVPPLMVFTFMLFLNKLRKAKTNTLIRILGLARTIRGWKGRKEKKQKAG